MPPLITIFAYSFRDFRIFANCSCLKSAARDHGRVASTQKVEEFWLPLNGELKQDFFFPTETIILNWKLQDGGLQKI